MQGVASILSQFAQAIGDFRLANAISDCLDLLDFSSDELSWSLSASQNPKGTPSYTVSYVLTFFYVLRFYFLFLKETEFD